MYSEFTHEITSLGLPNVVHARDRTHPKIVHPLSIDPFLEPLVTKLAKARPKWMLVGVRVCLNGSVRHFEVWEGGEELGGFGREYFRGYDAICVRNPRIQKARTRGHDAYTKDTTKAFKTIISAFGTKTVSELVAQARSAVATSAMSCYQAARYAYNNSTNKLNTHAEKYILDNWEDFKMKAVVAGADAGALEAFPEVVRTNRDTERIYTETTTNMEDATVVVLRGEEYILTHKGSTSIVGTDALPPAVKRAVGMLKLAEPNTCLPDIGFKASDTEMVVLTDVET